MYRSITRAIAAALAAISILVVAPTLVGATSPPYEGTDALPRGMAGVDGEVTRIYRAVLDRTPDDDGLRYWTDERQRGVPLDAVVGSFRTSAEFEQRFASMLDAPVEAWVDTMYQRVLGRDADAAGKAYWTDLVDSGAATRESLIIYFADSVEYRIVTGTGPEGFAHRVEESRRRYQAQGDDYSYEVAFETPFDFGSTTRFEVADGVVVTRSYEAWRRENGATAVTETWTETGPELGSHTDAAPVRTVDQVHDACRDHLDTLDPRQFELVLGVDDAGLMTYCGGFDPRIADSPGEIVSIEAFAVSG